MLGSIVLFFSNNMLILKLSLESRSQFNKENVIIPEEKQQGHPPNIGNSSFSRTKESSSFTSPSIIKDRNRSPIFLQNSPAQRGLVPTEQAGP